MATLQLFDAQVQVNLVREDPRLAQDLLDHLALHRPQVFEAYPIGYLQWVVEDTLVIAESFELQDVYALRTFLQLRFDVAPGFWREPKIAEVLGDRQLPAMARWRLLSTDAYGQAWLDAAKFNDAAEWRRNLWS